MTPLHISDLLLSWTRARLVNRQIVMSRHMREGFFAMYPFLGKVTNAT